MGISISSWLYRIAGNEINYYFRRNHYNIRYFSELVEEYGLDWIDSQTANSEKKAVLQQMENYQDFQLIQSKMKLLQVKYQEVIALKYFEDKSIKEICEVLGKKEGTIKSLLSRGLEKLRNLME
jgi:RNA polymerase sigma-70 factor (ECF subfamily)